MGFSSRYAIFRHGNVPATGKKLSCLLHRQSRADTLTLVAATTIPGIAARIGSGRASIGGSGRPGPGWLLRSRRANRQATAGVGLTADFRLPDTVTRRRLVQAILWCRGCSMPGEVLVSGLQLRDRD